MRIKPVLVPDHDRSRLASANGPLYRCFNRPNSATSWQKAVAAVAAAQGLAEGNW
jgi:hypothetical protein